MLKQLLAASILLASVAATAAIHCVSDASQFRAALAAAVDNGEADDIRLTHTTFYASSTAPFRIHQTEAHALRISGGWSGIGSGSCILQSYDATRTILDGSYSTQVLDILILGSHAMVPVTVDTLTLRNGRSNGGFASGLSVGGLLDGAPTVIVDRIIVHDNVSTQENVSAVSLDSDDHFVRFSNSIVRHNTTINVPAVSMLSNDGGAALNHVSLIYNTGTSGGGAIVMRGSASAQVTGSLFWGNADGDLYAQGNVRYHHNRFGTGNLTLIEQAGFGNAQIADPMLQSTIVPRPLAASPLRNQGASTVSTRDVYGRSRTLGGYADTGAVEYIE